MKKVFNQGALTMPPPAKNTIVILFAFAFFNMLAPMVQAQTLTLSASNYNSYNISCFGGQNGSINLTITGGTPPYTIRWSTDATTQNISNLPAGYYHVEVDDADTLTGMVEAEITLTEPEEIRGEVIASDYVVE